MRNKLLYRIGLQVIPVSCGIYLRQYFSYELQF